ncbi:MAG: hypothetical protein KGL39_14370 [Patescibacteria group bacterium]|nr:hypothetical protein [Patescibacteria group bacterium]
MKLSKSQFDKIAKAAERKRKRAQKAAILWPKKNKKPKRLKFWSSKGKIGEIIVRNLGILDRLYNGDECRIHQGQHHPGSLAYHIIPQAYGNAARFERDNVVWACLGANNWERNFRGHRTRAVHVALFGAPRIERLEKLSDTMRQFTLADLREILTKVRKEIAKLGGIPK